MRVHSNKIVSAGVHHLRRLRQLRHVLNRERRQKLVSALILSRVDYCNSVLVGLPLNTISPLRRLLNAAARFVAGLRSRDHVTAALRDLHWLKIDQRITFKLCVLMHSIVYGYSPQYMADMVTSVSSLPSRTHLRSLLECLMFLGLVLDKDRKLSQLLVLVPGIHCLYCY